MGCGWARCAFDYVTTRNFMRNAPIEPCEKTTLFRSRTDVSFILRCIICVIRDRFLHSGSWLLSDFLHPIAFLRTMACVVTSLFDSGALNKDPPYPQWMFHAALDVFKRVGDLRAMEIHA